MRLTEVRSKLVVVGIGETKTAKTGQEILTEALASCIGIGFGQVGLEKAWLSHTTDDASIRSINAQVRKFLCSIPDPRVIRAFLRGGAPTFLSAQDLLAAQNRREDIQNLLVKNGVLEENINVDWLTDPNHEASMKIKVDTGICVSNKEYAFSSGGLYLSAIA